MDEFKKKNTTVMKTILQGWNFMRIVRLVLGIIIMVQGITEREPVTIILGLLFSGMAVANIGCCGTNGCAVNPGRSIKNKTKEPIYEEVDAIK